MSQAFGHGTRLAASLNTGRKEFLFSPRWSAKTSRRTKKQSNQKTLSNRSPICLASEPCMSSITQTEGKELPVLTEVQGDVSGYRERLFKFVEGQGVELNYSERIGPAKGLSHGGKITLLLGMQPAEEFSTLVHEIAHLCGAEIYVASASGHV
jgi:hypothetical protein